MKTIILKVSLTKEEDGRWSAIIPTLPGCSSWGYSEPEALANIKDAAEIYIEDMIDAGEVFQVLCRVMDNIVLTGLS